MKFIFERDMKKKGDCLRCPCLKINTDFTSFFCELLGKRHPEESECPLEEAKSTEWHPYPKDPPPISDYYLVSYRRGSMELVHTCLFTGSGEFVANDKNIYAWAELPKPYEEEKAE